MATLVAAALELPVSASVCCLLVSSALLVHSVGAEQLFRTFLRPAPCSVPCAVVPAVKMGFTGIVFLLFKRAFSVRCLCLCGCLCLLYYITQGITGPGKTLCSGDSPVPPQLAWEGLLIVTLQETESP